MGCPAPDAGQPLFGCNSFVTETGIPRDGRLKLGIRADGYKLSRRPRAFPHSIDL